MKGQNELLYPKVNFHIEIWIIFFNLKKIWSYYYFHDLLWYCYMDKIIHIVTCDTYDGFSQLSSYFHENSFQ